MVKFNGDGFEDYLNTIFPASPPLEGVLSRRNPEKLTGLLTCALYFQDESLARRLLDHAQKLDFNVIHVPRLIIDLVTLKRICRAVGNLSGQLHELVKKLIKEYVVESKVNHKNLINSWETAFWLVGVDKQRDMEALQDTKDKVRSQARDLERKAHAIDHLEDALEQRDLEIAKVRQEISCKAREHEEVQANDRTKTTDLEEANRALTQHVKDVEKHYKNRLTHCIIRDMNVQSSIAEVQKATKRLDEAIEAGSRCGDV